MSTYLYLLKIDDELINFKQSMLKIFSLFFYLILFSKTVFAKDYYLWIEIKVHCSGDIFQIKEGGKFVDVNGHPVYFYMQSLAGRTHTSYNRGTVSSDVFNLEQNVFDFKMGVGGR